MSTAIARPEPQAQGYPIDRVAVLKTLDLNPEDPKTQTVLLICERYGLDPLLKHIVLIQGRPYVTRDGLLHVAHRSRKLDGIEVLEQHETPTHYTAKVAVYRKDMRRPFQYIGRYPKVGTNKAYGPEMAVKCGEVMALRRAFDVGLCAREELWDQEVEHEIEITPPAERPLRSTMPVKEAVVPSVDRLRDFRKWLDAFVARVNSRWVEHWTSADGELEPGISAELIRRWQLCGHLVKWAASKKLLTAPDENNAGLRDAAMSRIWPEEKQAIEEESNRYCHKIWRQTEQAANNDREINPENESQEIVEEQEA